MHRTASWLALLGACSPPAVEPADSDTDRFDLPWVDTADTGLGFAHACHAAGTCCPVPRAPVLPELTAADPLVFTAPSGTIEVALLRDHLPLDEAVWMPGDRLEAGDETGSFRFLARVVDPGCETGPVFDHVATVVTAFSGPRGTPGSQAVAHDDPHVVGWATGVAEAVWGTDVLPAWQVPERALGPAGGSGDVCSLGRGGQVTLTFDPPVTNGPGPDLAVFENGFSHRFLELAWVEVSSDGQAFARFDVAAHTPQPVAQYGELDPGAVLGVAGRHRALDGTPFDLAWLRVHPAVRDGQVDLDAITHVRLVDVVGDGSARDAWDRPIHDPFPTIETAGFDLDAVAVLRWQAPR
ncbi:MAG: hypothetical protein H6732_03975 [Alphaproteobacteria bacterium]|nr:hypothetical protein [Alphaproteobacteria bacterium]